MRVLVVEDEQRLAAGLRNGLTAEGFAVDVALDGTDGLWMAREHPYDVIVLDIMLARLEQAQARQRRLVSDASHELRSPVAAIRQHAEVALAHPDRTTVGELAETVPAEDLRLQRLAEDLLLLTRADEHTLGLRRRPVDLDDLVFDEARRLRGASGLRVDTSAVFGRPGRG